ncbi:helix-turn-helix domain-containing protein [Streptomyces sp. B6B3]|uniref:TetR/AcrR family transcriptional regulator n=1 Tax=Streptomyces sp. B6B3 TaxID=3153570 RepID=UPI00325F945A
MGETTGPRLRADARRNRERLLAEARAAFLAHGTEASLEEIAACAGVGIGTLYRHFPTRQALLEALLRERFDALAATGRDLLGGRRPPEAALRVWVLALVEMSTTYRGLTAVLVDTLRDDASDLHASCVAMRDAGAALLTAAQRAGAVRSDLAALDVLTLVSAVAWAHERTPDGARERLDRLLDIVFTGLAAPPVTRSS